MSQYFSPYRSSRGDIKVELDLSNYATKIDLKNVTHVDVSSFASKTNLASLKTEVDKIDADKVKNAPVDLTKLSNVLKNGVVKKTEFNSLETKVDIIDTTNFILKTKYEKDRSEFEDKISKIDKKIPDISSLVKKTDFNAKVTTIEGKIPSISGLATNSSLTALEKKTDYNTKISDIENKVNDHNHDKYITTPECNTLAADVFKARLAAQTYLIRKPEFDSKLKEISDRVTKIKTKHLLVENKLKKLQKFDAAYFRGKSHFEEDDMQYYLVFQPMYKYFKRIAGVGSGNYIYFLKSKGLSDERLDSITAYNHKTTPELNFYGTKTRVEFNGSCLKQDKSHIIMEKQQIYTLFMR